jgi:ADP-ribose pyrophosphatase
VLSDHQAQGLAKICQSRVIHEGSVITVVEDAVEFPDGSTGVLDVVRHPGASAILPILGDPDDPDPTVLLIRQYRHAGGGWLLEIPAGRLERGEDSLTCAQRELEEETGYTARQLTPLISILTTPGFSDEVIHLFLAQDLVPGTTRHETDEFIEPVALTLSDVLSRIRTGEIRDAKSIVAILLTNRLRQGR